MGHATLLPDASELVLDSLRFELETIILMVHVRSPRAACPLCHNSSRRIHSYYERKLADLPWNGVPVHVQVRVRRLFCAMPGCGQHIFTERLPSTVASHARRTNRLSHLMDGLT